MTAQIPSRVTIHLQAGRRIGMGHLLRMLWLARSLRAWGLAVEALLRGDPEAAAMIQQAGFPVHVYAREPSAVAVVKRYVTTTPSLPHVWVNDCLKVKPQVHAVIHHRQIPIVSLDDAGEGLTPHDVVVNAMPSFWQEALSTQAQMCQGSEYMVLNPLVKGYHDRPKPIPEHPRRVVVTLGGSDPHGVVFKVLQAIPAIPYALEWDVFLGPLFPHLRRLDRWRRQLDGHAKIRWHHAELAVIPWFAQADVAICASGHTLFEMMGVGAPVLAVANAPHEIVNARYFASLGGCHFLGRYANVTTSSIAQALMKLLGDPAQRVALSQRGKSLIDGRGIERVAQLIQEVAASTSSRPNLGAAKGPTLRRPVGSSSPKPSLQRGEGTSVVLCDQLKRLRAMVSARPSEKIQFLVISEIPESDQIRRYLRHQLGAEALPYVELARSRRESFRAKYIEFMAAFNRAHRSQFWLAMPFTTKSVLSTDLCRNTFNFLLIVELLRTHEGLLVVLTDNRPLADQVVRWARAQRLKAVNAVAGRQALKAFLKRATHLAIVAAIVRTAWAWVVARRLQIEPADQREATVVVTTFPNSSIDPPQYREAYFGPLPDYLNQSGERVVLFALCYEGVVQKIRALRRVKSRIPVVPVESCLTLWDLVACATRSLVQWVRRFPFRELVQIDGVDFSGLMEQAIADSCQSSSLFWHLCVHAGSKRLGQRLHVRRCLYPFENRAWEKMLLTGLREVSPHTTTVGYQHTAFTHAHTNLVFGHGEARVTPLPDVILTAGHVVKQWLDHTGQYPEGLLKVGCALYQRQGDHAQRRMQRPAQIVRLLVVLSNDLEEYVRTGQFVAEALAATQDYQVRLRPHPGLNIRLEDALKIIPEHGRNGYEISHGSLREDLAWAHVVLYASSTVALDAIGQGVPAIYADLGKSVDADPLIGTEDLRWSVRGPAQLISTIRDIERLPHEAFERWQQRAHDYATRYFLPATDEGLRAFAEAGKGNHESEAALQGVSHE